MPKPFTEAERQQFLAGRHIAVLSVAADSGRPPASVPIWYHYTPGGNGRAFVAQFDSDMTVLYTIRPDRWFSSDYTDDI